MNHPLLNANKTVLNDRTVWFDGDMTIKVNRLVDMIQRGVDPSKIYVDEITEDVKQYNKVARHRISVKEELKKLSIDWDIDLSTINFESYLVDKFAEHCKNQQFTDAQFQIRSERLLQELKLYTTRDLMDILRVIIYVINTLEENNIVWGVGRGSSVSSYILYLIGAHDVDSVEYDLDISDFIQ